MKAPKPPETPDPYETASAQQVANVEVAVANTALSNADEDHPGGTVRFVQTSDFIVTNTYDGNGVVTGTRNIYRWKKTTALTASAQTIYDQQEIISNAMNSWAISQIGYLDSQQDSPLTDLILSPRRALPDPAILETSAPVLGSFTEQIGTQDNAAHYETVRDSINERLQYQIEVDKAAKIADLSHRGIVPGMEAYDDALFEFTKQSNDARTQAFLASGQEQTRMVTLEGTIGSFRNETTELKFRLNAAIDDIRNDRLLKQYQAYEDAADFVQAQRARELQEAIALRGANINELTSLMHGGKVDVPQFANFKSAAIGKTPVASSVYQSAAMDVQKWQMKTQQQQQMFGGIMAGVGNMAGAAIAMSDRRLKIDIEHVGFWRGFRVYTWQYLWGERSTGLMAQEVNDFRPDAILDVEGFMAIDYGVLNAV